MLWFEMDGRGGWMRREDGEGKEELYWRYRDNPQTGLMWAICPLVAGGLFFGF